MKVACFWPFPPEETDAMTYTPKPEDKRPKEGQTDFSARKCEHLRCGGLLLPVTSLPSPYCIGDLGPEAYRFIDFLHAARQRIWQVLPVGPTDGGQSHSPYAALSGMAGNSLLISPDLMRDEGWLTNGDLKEYAGASGDVDYATAEKIKHALLQAGFARFEQKRDSGTFSAFRRFCKKQQGWLEDYSVFTVLNDVYSGAPWWEWPDAYRNRFAPALADFAGKYRREIDFIKWTQFVFNRQWRRLKQYARKQRVELLGDLPFYAGHHSCDVWRDRQFFSLRPDGSARTVAGVPPDFFSDIGQVWGMPVYNWRALKRTGYAWWAARLERNLEWFDILRLDHFRAFSSYWEIPAKAETAAGGTWRRGPGSGFFKVMKRRLGHLPFIAEDLGDLTDDVCRLRKRWALPGMKVLQFAFGRDMPVSGFIPHHYTADFFSYTGTHDNNTVRGWYRHELSEGGRRRVKAYLGQNVNEENLPAKLIRLLYASVAGAVIIPVQDLLGLDENARMNRPGAVSSHNWVWRLKKGQLTPRHAGILREYAALYDR